MKALWLCFALVCFQCQTAPGLAKPLLREGRQRGRVRPTARPDTASAGRTPLTVQAIARALALL